MVEISFNEFKTWFLPQLLISYAFLVSGVIVTFVQFLTYVFIWPFDKLLYRKLNNYLAAALWSNITSLAQWWSGTDLEMFVDKKEDLEMVGKENAFCVMNHKYDIDWLFGWILCQRANILGGSKVVMKHSLKYVPLLGSSWSFNEYIFVKRVWETDQKTLQKELNTIFDYPKDLHYTITLFCEGTRFSKDKHEASTEIAKKKGLTPLKHHLLPRTKGFFLVASQVKDKVDYLYDINLGVKDINGHRPNLMDIKNGVPVVGQIYLRRIPISQVPVDDEKKCAEFLYKLYEEKDKIHDVFDKHGDFSPLGVEKHQLKKNKKDLYVSIAWLVTILVPSVYYLLIFLWNGSLLFRVGFLFSLLIVYYGTNWIISRSDSKNASKFGLKKEN